MDEQLDKELPQPGGNEQGQATPNAGKDPGSGDMPLLAASAAARMVQDILGRLSGPHAGTAPGMLRPSSLWRQVARRMGASPGPQPGTASPVQPSQAHGLLGPPHPDFAWRARHHHSAQAEVEANDWPSWDPPTPRPAPTFTGLQSPATAPGPGPEAPVVATSAPSSAPAVSSEQQQQSEPPVFIPSKVVQIEYVPGPAVVPATPLAAPRMPLPQPSSDLQATVSRTLGTQLNQEFVVPTNDLLARMAYTYEVEPAPPAPLPLPLPTPQQEFIPAEPVASTFPTFVEPSVTLTGAARDVETVLAPQAQPPSVQMPLTTPPVMRKAREAQPAPGYIMPVEEKGRVARLFDRVIAALPVLEPFRRAESPIEQPASPEFSALPRASAPEDIISQDTNRGAASPGDSQSSPTPTAQPSPASVQPTLDGEATLRTPRPAQPAEANETGPSTITGRPSQGAMGAFIGRLFGSESSAGQGAGRTPVSMPWARRGNKQSANESSDDSPPTTSQPYPSRASTPDQPAALTPPTPAASQAVSPLQRQETEVATTFQASPQPSQAGTPEDAPAEPTLVEPAQEQRAATPSVEPETPGAVTSARGEAAVASDANAITGSAGAVEFASYPTTGDSPAAPTQVQPYMGAENASHGFFGTLVDRMLRVSPTPSHEQQTEGSTSIAMPQARRSRTRSATGEQQASAFGKQAAPPALPPPSLSVSYTATPTTSTSAESAASSAPAVVSVQPSLDTEVIPQVQERAQAPQKDGVQPSIEEAQSQEASVQEGRAQGATIPQVAQATPTASTTTASVRPTESQPYTGADRGAQGLLGAIVSRLLGGETTSQRQTSGPAPLPMPWVQQPSRHPSADEDVESEGQHEAPEPRSTWQPEQVITTTVLSPPETSQTEYQPIAQPAIPSEAVSQSLPDSVVAPAISLEQPVYEQEPPAIQPAQPLVAAEETATSAHAGGVERAEQTWDALADMAEDIVRSHTPLAAVEPVGGAIRSGFLNRIFRRQGHGLTPTQAMLNGPSEVVSTEGAAQPADNWTWTPAFMNRPGMSRAEEGAANMGPIARLASFAPGSITAPLAASTPMGQLSDPNSILVSQAPTTVGSLRIHYTPPMAATSQASDDGQRTTDDGLLLPPMINRPMSVIRPLSQMSQTLGDYSGSEPEPDEDMGEEGESGVPDYMALLQQYYGGELGNEPGGNPERPLAHPYAAFAAPGGWQSRDAGVAMDYPTSAPRTSPSRSSVSGWAATPSTPGQYAPPSYEAPRNPEPSYQSEDGVAGMIDGINWGIQSQDSSYGNGDASGGEAGAWANVVSSAVSSHSSGTPALALSGEERPVAPQPTQEHSDKPHDGSNQQDVEELADSVYAIIRRKLLIERERNW